MLLGGPRSHLELLEAADELLGQLIVLGVLLQLGQLFGELNQLALDRLDRVAGHRVVEQRAGGRDFLAGAEKKDVSGGEEEER